MIEYKRKYKSKYKAGKSEWFVMLHQNSISAMDWKLFNIKLNGIVYTSPNTQFQAEYEKLLMWGKLKQ